MTMPALARGEPASTAPESPLLAQQPAPQTEAFDYGTAFARNIGWVTPAEQQRLRGATVAIAGLGGVGGAHALALGRLGIGGFRLADFDQFGVHNFNRQAGAFMDTVGRDKLAVMAERVLAINPEARVARFPQGVQPDAIDEFLEGADVYIDGLDFFELGIRRQVFAACARRGIPALTAAPLGMGVSLLYFDPLGMDFERYFRLEGQTSVEQYARFIAGLSPAALHRHYLVHPEAVNFAERRGPSTGIACELCAAMTATATLQLLLGRGHLRAVPWVMQFDGYRQQLKHSWRPGGNHNPLQRALLRFIRPRLGMG